MSFSNEELYIMSDGILRLIQDNNTALTLLGNNVSDDAVMHIHELTEKYRQLNNKICSLIN